MRGDFFVAAVAVIAANVFDVLDGRVARVTKSTSDFGSEYDSLADLVAFGVAPAMLMYRFALEPWGTLGWLAAALYVVCGALRLARFNVQHDLVAKRDFVGLPIPAAAEVIATTVLLFIYLFTGVPEARRALWLMTAIVPAILMVSGFRYFSFKELRLRDRQPFSVLLGVIVGLLIFLAEPQIFLFAFSIGYAASGPLRSVFDRSDPDADADQDALGESGRDESSLTGNQESSSLPG